MKLKIAICILPLLFCFAGAVEDPIATEITRWLEFTRTNPATDEDWKSIKEITEPVLNRADIAIKNGHRFYALHLLGAAKPLVAAPPPLKRRVK